MTLSSDSGATKRQLDREPRANAGGEEEHLAWAPHLPTWVFDLDGCILDSLTGTSLRPGAKELLSHLRVSGCRVLLWSAGGADYARARAAEQTVAELFHGFYAKTLRDQSGRYVTTELNVLVTATIFVDDRPEDMPMDADVMAVHPYLSHNPHDRGLSEVAQRAGISRARHAG